MHNGGSRSYNTEQLGVTQLPSDFGKVQLMHEYVWLLLKGVETATGLWQLLRDITLSGSCHSPMKWTDLGGPSLNKHRGVSRRNGSISKFSSSNRAELLTFSFKLWAVLEKVVASKKTLDVVMSENFCRMRMTSPWVRCCIIIRVMMRS